MTNPTPPRQPKLDPYDEIIEIFESVHLRAKQREDILAWHHKQLLDSFIELLDLEWDGKTWAQDAYWKGQKDLRNQLRQAAKEKWGILSAKLIATCSYCGQEFNSHQEIQQHIEDVHTPKKQEGE